MEWLIEQVRNYIAHFLFSRPETSICRLLFFPALFWTATPAECRRQLSFWSPAFQWFLQTKCPRSSSSFVLFTLGGSVGQSNSPLWTEPQICGTLKSHRYLFLASGKLSSFHGGLCYQLGWKASGKDCIWKACHRCGYADGLSSCKALGT